MAALRDAGRLSTGEVAEAIGVSRPTASSHLQGTSGCGPYRLDRQVTQGSASFVVPVGVLTRGVLRFPTAKQLESWLSSSYQ